MFGSGYIVKKEERFSLNQNLFPLLYHHKSIKYDSYLQVRFIVFSMNHTEKHYRRNVSKIWLVVAQLLKSQYIHFMSYKRRRSICL